MKRGGTTKKKKKRTGAPRNAIRDACAVIHMGADDTAIGNAVSTVKGGRFHALHIVDPGRSKEDYANQDGLRALQDMGIKVHFEVREDAMKRRIAAAGNRMMVDIPPDLYATPQQVRGIVEHARIHWKDHKRFALAPTYELGYSPFNALPILLHVFWVLMSVFTWFRRYRATYLTVTVLSNEMGVLTTPTETHRNTEKEPYWFGGTGARSKPPPTRSGVNYFLYLVQKERFTWRTYVIMAFYVYVFAVPWWHLLGPQIIDPAEWRALFNKKALGTWFIHGLVGWLISRKYFDSPYRDVHGWMLPLWMPLWIVFAVYARWIWRGYAGAPPTLEIPPLLPRTQAGRGGIALPLSAATSGDDVDIHEDSSSDGDSGEGGNSGAEDPQQSSPRIITERNPL